MAYNDTFINTSNNLYDVVDGVNTASGGILVYLILLIVFIFVYAQTIKNGASSALMASSLVSLMVAILFWWAGLIFWWIVIAPIIIFVISLGIRFFKGG